MPPRKGLVRLIILWVKGEVPVDSYFESSVGAKSNSLGYCVTHITCLYTHRNEVQSGHFSISFFSDLALMLLK